MSDDNDPEARARAIEDALRATEPKKRADADEGGAVAQALDKLTTMLERLGAKADGLEKRMDAEEASGGGRVAAERYPLNGDDDEEDDDFDSLPQDEQDELTAAEAKRMPGQPKEIANDAARTRYDAARAREDRGMRRRRVEMRKANVQSRADSVAQMHGEAALKPMQGETLRAYRLRLLRRFMPHSKEYRDIDLGAVRDPKLFNAIEGRVYADASEAARNPRVPAWNLVQRTRRDDGGHTIHEFHGDPRAWMERFGRARAFVVGFDTKRSSA